VTGVDDEKPLVVEKPLSKPRWMVLASVFFSTALLTVAGVLYTGHVDGKREQAEREADRRWCELLGTLDDAYGSTPPSTDLGRRVAEAVHALRVGLDC
jgi:hypothetical protein